MTAAGVRKIDGRVLGDDSRYDAQRFLPTWKPSYAADGDVGPLSALTVDDGLVAWKPKAVAAPDPAVHGAEVLTTLLETRGVEVTGAAGRDRAPTGGKQVAALPSLPLRQIVGEMLVHSDNETAELLAKEMGRRFGGAPTSPAGITVMRAALAQMGIDVSTVATSDASGLDANDRITCNALYTLLSGPERDALLSAGLAVAGKTGTMFDRFVGHPAAGRLRAKTGTLEGVDGLAGYVDPLDAAGAPLRFAFLANSLPRPSELRGKQMNDKLGAALATYPDAPTAASLAP
jgi:D-alanyl-D-alanine carboxypeptidase/D-alanyl-D-alanine-endopeptidase (penicillin-binding protein 4)